MPNRNPGLALQVAFVLVSHDMSDAPTFGDLMQILGCPKGTAMGERLREARSYYGITIKCFRDAEKRYRYFLPQGTKRAVMQRPEYLPWLKKQTAKGGRKAA